MNILIIEDTYAHLIGNSDHLSASIQKLKNSGHTVTIVRMMHEESHSRIEDIFRKWEHGVRTFDVVLTDLIMPCTFKGPLEPIGYEYAKRAKALGCKHVSIFSDVSRHDSAVTERLDKELNRPIHQAMRRGTPREEAYGDCIRFLHSGDIIGNQYFINLPQSDGRAPRPMSRKEAYSIIDLIYKKIGLTEDSPIIQQKNWAAALWLTLNHYGSHDQPTPDSEAYKRYVEEAEV